MTHPMPQIRRIPAAAAVAGALLALLAAQVPTAEARDRAAAQRPARVMPQRPAPARPPVSRTTETQRTDTGYVRNTTLTRPDGATATQQRTVVNDRDAGTRSIDVTRTGFDGKTRTMSQDTQRTENGWTSSRTLTNAPVARSRSPTIRTGRSIRCAPGWTASMNASTSS